MVVMFYVNSVAVNFLLIGFALEWRGELYKVEK